MSAYHSCRRLSMQPDKHATLRAPERTALPGHLGSLYKSLPCWRTDAAAPPLTYQSPTSRQTLTWRMMPQQCPWLHVSVRLKNGGARSGTMPEPKNLLTVPMSTMKLGHRHSLDRARAIRTHRAPEILRAHPSAACVLCGFVQCVPALSVAAGCRPALAGARTAIADFAMISCLS